MYFSCYGNKDECKDLIRRFQNTQIIYTPDIYKADIILCEISRLEAEKQIAKKRGLPDKRWIGFQVNKQSQKITFVKNKKSDQDFISYNEMPKRKPEGNFLLGQESKDKKQRIQTTFENQNRDKSFVVKMIEENKQRYDKQSDKTMFDTSMDTTSNTNQQIRKNSTKVSNQPLPPSKNVLHQALSTPNIRDLIFGSLSSVESMGLARANKTLSGTVPAGIDRINVNGLDSFFEMIRSGQTFDKLKHINVLKDRTKEKEPNIVLKKSQFPELRSLVLPEFPYKGKLEIQSVKLRTFEMHWGGSTSLHLPPSLVVLKVRQMNDCNALPQLVSSLPLLEILEVTSYMSHSDGLVLDVRSHRHLKHIRIRTFNEHTDVKLHSLENIEVLEGYAVNFTVEKKVRTSPVQFLKLDCLYHVPYFLEGTQFPQLNLFSLGIDIHSYNSVGRENENIRQSLEIAGRVFREATNRDQDSLIPFAPGADFSCEFDDLMYILYCSSCFCIKQLNLRKRRFYEEIFLYKTSNLDELEIYRPKKNWILKPMCQSIQKVEIRNYNNVTIDLFKSVKTISELDLRGIPSWKEWNEHIMPSLPVVTKSLSISYKSNYEEKQGEEEEKEEEEEEEDSTQIKLFRQPSVQFVRFSSPLNDNSPNVSLQLGECKELETLEMEINTKNFQVYVEEAPKLQKIKVHSKTESFKVLNGPRQRNHVTILRTLFVLPW